MQRTHLALIVLLILILAPFMSHPIVFGIFALAASLIPDMDSENSLVGRYRVLRIFQIFTKHRGMIHSLSFCILISVLLALFIPVLAFPVYLGYAVHLLADSITLEGIQPFWPLKRRSDGWIRTNSSVEHAIFLTLVLLNLLVLFSKAMELL